MTDDFGLSGEFALGFGDLGRDVGHGYLSIRIRPSGHHRQPRLVLNDDSYSVLRAIREELRRSTSFTFSVAFVSARAIALLKQEFLDFEGAGRIITSDYLAFNSPSAFRELENLTKHTTVDVRIHKSDAFHPKGYIFEHRAGITAMVGSSNLTAGALAKNHEWNLRVSAARGSDLAHQFARLVERQLADSTTITREWIETYDEAYVPPAPRPAKAPVLEPDGGPRTVLLLPNRMQRDALAAIEAVRVDGARRAIVISATGTGKTILSAMDVRAVNPQRLLFVAHREQILDKTISEYRRVLDAPASDFGKLTGATKQSDRRYVFATIQTLSRPDVLPAFRPDSFDYIIMDEAHRSGAESYQHVLAHFRPQFLLGMTATPERTDGFNVFETFDYTVPYEIRLNHALEEDMLSPFHYYGVAEITFDDGRTVTGDSDLSVLISTARVSHLVESLERYGQAGVAPRGLIFCSRNAEAASLSAALNRRTLHGRQLRTVALSGTDSVIRREEVVTELERGELDYVLTVDVFNEGVDIPSVNQVVMLRQTKSAIVFVQQLGRGLRKSPDKEYLVVIDFIGSYANNFMIPIALFGDDSLNKESLRKSLISSEERGVLPGLSSVRFDRVAQDRVMRAISETKLDSIVRLKAAIEAMRNRVGGPPKLWDFLRFESVDPVLLATARDHYPALLASILRIDLHLAPHESRALRLLSHEVLSSRRLHEFMLLATLFERGEMSRDDIRELYRQHGLRATDADIDSSIDTLTLSEFAEADLRRYGSGVAQKKADRSVELSQQVLESYATSHEFRSAVDDLLKTGIQLVSDRYEREPLFTTGRQYSRKEVCRILGWPRKWSPTVYGYRTDRPSGYCPIFVTLHKSDEVSASTAYEDELLDRSTMHWFTRSRRTLQSDEVAAVVAGDVALFVFVKKDDAEGTDFYYLGSAVATQPKETTMPGDRGEALKVVQMLLRFERPIDAALYDYFHPMVTST